MSKNSSNILIATGSEYMSVTPITPWPIAPPVPGLIYNRLSATSIDLPRLVFELQQLRQALIIDATDPEDYEAIGAVRGAEIEAAKGDEREALRFLSKAGVWGLEVATKIGVSLAAEAITRSLGIR